MTFAKSIYFGWEYGAGAYVWSLDHDSRDPRAKVCGESSNRWTFQGHSALQKPAGPALCAGKLHRVLILSWLSYRFFYAFEGSNFCVYKSRSWGCGCMQYMVCFEAKADIGRSC